MKDKLTQAYSGLRRVQIGQLLGRGGDDLETFAIKPQLVALGDPDPFHFVPLVLK